MKKYCLYIASLLFLINSCHVYDRYQQNMKIPEDVYRKNLVSLGTEGDTVLLGVMPWKEFFTDVQLQVLIAKALDNNTNLLIAEQNIKSAAAAWKASKLAYLPSLVASPQGTISSFDWQQAVKTYSLPITASWQVDMSGSLRNAKMQATAQILQAKAAKQAVRTHIIASVANLYYSLLMLDEQLRVTQETSKIWRRNYETMAYMEEAGMTTTAAVASAKANYYQILATIPALEERIASAENALCLILRETPHKIARHHSFTFQLPSQLTQEIPLAQLAARPDVKSAELSLANAFYGVAGAYAKFYPNITLTGTLGFTNNAGVGIMNPGKMIANAVASLVQPLFMRGQVKANLDIAKANREVAQLKFEQVLLTAGSEVSNSLMSYHSAKKQEEQRRLQVRELESAAEKVHLLFEHTNSTSYLETLTAESSLLNARLALVNDQFAGLQAAINLYTALGGGVEPASEQDKKHYNAIVK